MSILDPIFARMSDAPDNLVSLSKQVNLAPAKAEKAIMALAHTHVAAGDTISNAAIKTGHDASVLTAIVSALGGEGALKFIAAGLSNDLGSLAQGNIIEDIAYMFSGSSKAR